MNTSGYSLFSIVNLVDIFVNRSLGMTKDVNKDLRFYLNFCVENARVNN